MSLSVDISGFESFGIMVQDGFEEFISLCQISLIDQFTASSGKTTHSGGIYKSELEVVI